MKLNLGCGYKKLEGYINVDYDNSLDVDELWNLENTPWPWIDNSCFEVRAHHILEHLGRSPGNFLNIMKELYRVCRNEAIIEIIVPYIAHDSFWSDPTHCRPITKTLLQGFDLEMNKKYIEGGYANTTFAMRTGVNFKILEDQAVIDQDAERYLNMLEEGARKLFLRFGWNVITQVQFKLQVIK